MASRLQNHELSTSDTQDQVSVRKFITRKLLQEDSSLALVALQFLVNPANLEPKDKKLSLSEWSTQQTKFEWDHQGNFREIRDLLYHYDGAETKYNYGCKDSRHNLTYRQ